MSGSVGIGTSSPISILHTVTSDTTVTPLIERSGQTTDALANSMRVLATKTTDMGDGFGVTAQFNIRDNADVINGIGSIGAVRAGADNTGDLVFRPFATGSGNERMRITSAGTVQPGANGTQDLGTTSLRWSTIYTSDLSLSNGIGDYTIVEGEEKLYLYNNKNNKVYSFVLQEEDPLTATPKKS